jgi:hypothetical protein
VVSLKEHPEIPEDLRQIDIADPSVSVRVTRLNEFVKEIERVSRSQAYGQKWPDRVPEVDPSISVDARESIRPVTLYLWQREGFMLCLEERWTSADASRPKFRWLVCAPDVDAQTALTMAIRRAQTAWS